MVIRFFESYKRNLFLLVSLDLPLNTLVRKNYHYCLFIIVSVQVVSLLRHALQPCISNVTVDWGLGDDDKPGPGSIEVETKKTLFGYGKPKSSPDPPTIRWQAPAKVSRSYVCFFPVNIVSFPRYQLSTMEHVCLSTDCCRNRYQIED